MQNQMPADVNSLFSSFLNKPVQNTNANSKTPQTYVPIRNTQNRAKTLHYLKALAVVGAAGIGLYGVYAKGKKVGECKALDGFDKKIESLKEEIEKNVTTSVAGAFKKNKPEVNLKELDKILAQINSLSSNDAKTQKTLQNIIASLNEITTGNEKSKTAVEETFALIFEEITKIQDKQNGQIGQKELDALKNTIEKSLKTNNGAIKDIVEQNLKSNNGVIKDIVGKLEKENVATILANKANGEMPQIVTQKVDIEPVLSAISSLSDKLTAKTAMDTVSNKAIIDTLGNLADDIRKLDNDEISKFTDEILSSIENLKNDNKLSEKALIETLTKTVKDVKKGLVVNTTVEKTELSQENIKKIENIIKDTVENSVESLKLASEKTAKKAYLAPEITIKEKYIAPEITITKGNNEKLAQGAQEILEEQSQEPLLLTSPKLSSIEFDKGIAYAKNGEKYTGVIEDTLKTGDKVVIEFEDGLITKSTKSKDNQTIFEKIYKRNFIYPKNIEKTTVTIKDNSDVEKIYCSLNQKDTKNRSFNVTEKYLNDKIKKEVTRYEANAKSRTLTKSLPNGQLIQTKVMADNSASKQIIQPATKYKNIGTDSQGYKAFKIDV